jgi:hypothetical protein
MEHGDEVKLPSESKYPGGLSKELRNVQKVDLRGGITSHPPFLNRGDVVQMTLHLFRMKGVVLSKSPKLLNLNLIAPYVTGLSGPGKCSGELKGNSIVLMADMSALNGTMKRVFPSVARSFRWAVDSIQVGSWMQCPRRKLQSVSFRR